VGYGPILLAKDKDFFEGIEVDIRFIEDTAARRAALVGNNVDASTDIVDSFTNFLASGFQASAVLKLDDSMGGDGIVVKPGINSVADLAGKSIAFPPGQPSHFFLLSVLEEAGVDIKSLKTKEMEPDQAGSAFISGNVDAAVTWEPWLTKAAEQGGKILTTSREKPGLIVDILVVRNDYLAENPEVFEVFIRGWYRAVEYWRENTKEANLIMAQALQIDPDEFETMVAGVKYADRQANVDFFRRDANGNSAFTRLVTKASSTWNQQGVITKEVDPKVADGSGLLLKLEP
jgi:NitT/TauT family transport system substrate-binding protein